MLSLLDTLQSSQNSHIRFDNEDDETPLLDKAVHPLTHPRILAIAGGNTARPNGPPNLSPIEPNAQNVFLGQNKTMNVTDHVNKKNGGNGMKRKDSYTNRSQIMESTRVDKDTQPKVRYIILLWLSLDHRCLR